MSKQNLGLKGEMENELKRKQNNKRSIKVVVIIKPKVMALHEVSSIFVKALCLIAQ